MAGQNATAGDVETALYSVGNETELANIRKRLAPDEPAIGMRMRDLFDTAKAFSDLPLAEVNVLLDHPAYEPRMAAMCILDFQARGHLDDTVRREMFQLYLDRHDRITTWDMVDRSAPRVVGAFLAGRSPAPLRKLAKAAQPLRRRTAITAPLYFVRAGTDDDVENGFSIAGLLATDPMPEVHNAVGIFLKHASGRDLDSVHRFLDAHAGSMPRPALRLATEKLSAADRARYRS